ncbi:hypothetical protein O6H91_09G031500 [Diphasiastrum complanatum]|uniref:Uncharacterized protein n=1 Tax=Diphasiastrum complanatum TaxID=34168 RepID=A0ACC2CMQ1_DIPCM|nr:hypothetical protein O6H91_09G031500 [Diphasiastrum complanatum]
MLDRSAVLATCHSPHINNIECSHKAFPKPEVASLSKHPYLTSAAGIASASLKCCTAICGSQTCFANRIAEHGRVRGESGGGIMHWNGRRPFRGGKMNIQVRVAEVDAKDIEWDHESYQALLQGGEEVASVMKEITELLQDIAGMDKEAEDAALQMAVTGTIGQRLEKLDGSFLMALDWMMAQAEKDDDKKKTELLQMIKDTVLSQLTEKFPSHVQVVSMLCTTSSKEHRQTILRNSAGGGGTFGTESGGKLLIPGANLNEIANQADDILATIEEKPIIKDRQLLAKLVLIREEARSMMGGGLLDDRNDNRGLKNLPEPEVNFLSTLAAMRPGSSLRERITNVMNGKDEGADRAPESNQSAEQDVKSSHPKSRSVRHMLRAKRRAAALPVRPGIFLDTVLAGMYKVGASGVTVQHLEWVHKETLKILQEIAFV